MSQRKYVNPVTNHFVYNDETRKSTCKECLFDMAGRHSENLMRHLKRKHPYIYQQVMREKQYRRSLHQQQRGGSGGAVTSFYGNVSTRSLSSMFQFDSKPQKLYIKVDANDSLNGTARASSDSAEDEEAASTSQPSNEQFDGIYIGKSEVIDDSDNEDDKQTAYQDADQLEAPSSILPPSESTAGNSEAIMPAIAATHSLSLNSVNSMDAVEPVPNTVAGVTAGGAGVTAADGDSYFLQYLAHKMSKYSERTKNKVQYLINNALYKADMGELEDEAME